MSRIVQSLGLVLLVFVVTVRAASTPTPPEVAQFAERLLADAVQADGPGMAVLVARGDRVLYRGARGRASVELAVPLTPEHVFRIGSVTKQFAAAGLLKLIDDGKARLDDPLSKYLPDYPGGAAITLRQLLNHTSGVRSYTSIPGYMAEGVRRDLDTAALIAVFKDEPVDFAPGSDWRYNNSGYVLVGAVIEAITGQPWHAYLEQALLQPLGLAHTRHGDDRTLIAGAADGYSLGPQGEVARAGALSMTQPHAAGGLVSTVDDLWRWNRALHGGQAISARSYRRMTTPEGPAAAPANHYGYGIQTGTVRDRPVLVHGGGIFGFLSALLYVPQQDLTVVVLRNADGAGTNPALLARKLAAFALADPYPEPIAVALPKDALSALEGVYRLDADNARTLRLRDGKLTSQRSGGAPFELIPIGHDTFLFEDGLTRLSIERDREGAVTGMRFFEDGEGKGEVWPRSDEPLAERAEVALPRAALARLVGDYASPQLGFKVFFDEADVLRVQVPGQPPFALKAESVSRLFITEVDASFEFEPVEGRVERVTLIQGPKRISLERQAQ